MRVSDCIRARSFSLLGEKNKNTTSTLYISNKRQNSHIIVRAENIYFWLCWIFTAVCVLSLVVASGGTSLRNTGFLEHRLSSCSTQAASLCGRWDLSRPGFEPISPALAGRFLTTKLPGKPPKAQNIDDKSLNLENIRVKNKSLWITNMWNLKCFIYFYNTMFMKSYSQPSVSMVLHQMSLSYNRIIYW